MRTALDFGPLAVYLIVFYLTGKDVYISTAACMVASVISLAIYYHQTRKIAPIPAFTCGVMLVFGGLTIYLQDDAFVMMKPTIVYCFMGVGLVASAWTGKNVLGEAMGPYLKLPPEAWKIFLSRYGIFCLGMAGANEVLRRMLSFEVWLNVKIFGFTAIAFAFMFTQMPLLMKYMELDELKEGSEGDTVSAKNESGSARPEDPGSERE